MSALSDLCHKRGDAHHSEQEFVHHTQRFTVSEIVLSEDCFGDMKEHLFLLFFRGGDFVCLFVYNKRS